MARCVVAPAALGAHDRTIDLLAQAGCEILRLPAQADGWSGELLERYATRAEAFVGTFRGIGLPAEAIRAAPRLRVITSPIIGTEFIDVDAATTAGVIVAHGAIPENFEGMAEAGVMLIAALLKRLPQKATAFAAGGWKPGPSSRMVAGRTIGLIGFGRISRAIAARLSGWNVRLLADDPYVAPAEIARHGVEPVQRQELLERSDVVLVLTTLTPQTRHLIDREALARMKKGSHLINIGRGGCVDEAALLEALESGHLAGAAIDTWESEPPVADHPLRRHPLVIGTAHDVGHSDELVARLPIVAAQSTLEALDGRLPDYVRNPEAVELWRTRIAQLTASDK